MKRTLAAAALLLAVGCGAARSRTVPLPVPSRPLPELVSALRDPDPAVRARAAWDLVGAEASEPDVARGLVTALADPDRSVREAAAWTVGNLRGDLEEQPTRDDSLPRMVSQTKPFYPDAAFRRKVEGEVVVGLLISEEGRVVHAEVQKSVPGLDAAALSCVRQWVFTPALREGRPVPMFAVAPVSFRIF